MKYDMQDICNLIIKSGHKYVLISGNGASGKSTLSNNLQDTLQNTGKNVRVFHTDDFMLDKEHRKKTTKTYVGKDGKTKTQYMASTFPGSYDFSPLLSALKSDTSDIVIIEGIGAALLTEKLPDSYKIFIQIDKETEFQRRVCRARSGADLSKERCNIRYEQFEIFILPHAEKFDLRLISQNDFSFIEKV